MDSQSRTGDTRVAPGLRCEIPLRSGTARLGQQLTGRTTENKGCVGGDRVRSLRNDDSPATLVDEAMMVTAEQQGVVEIRGTTVRPRQRCGARR